jgi:hypothetical protein
MLIECWPGHLNNGENVRCLGEYDSIIKIPILKEIWLVSDWIQLLAFIDAIMNIRIP